MSVPSISSPGKHALGKLRPESVTYSVLSEESRLSHANSKLDAGMHAGIGIALARRHAHALWPTPKNLRLEVPQFEHDIDMIKT